jgi:hypothetical protein
MQFFRQNWLLCEDTSYSYTSIPEAKRLCATFKLSSSLHSDVIFKKHPDKKHYYKQLVERAKKRNEYSYKQWKASWLSFYKLSNPLRLSIIASPFSDTTAILSFLLFENTTLLLFLKKVIREKNMSLCVTYWRLRFLIYTTEHSHNCRSVVCYQFK